MKLRIKRLKMHPEALAKIMETGMSWSVIKGIPEGAIVKSATVDPYTLEMNLFIEHKSFPEVELSTVCPVLETEFLKIS